MRIRSLLLTLAALAAIPLQGVVPALAALSPPVWTVDGAAQNVGLGHSVATAGDVNGDGFSDVVVTAPPSLASTKYVYVFHGSPSGPPTTPSWTGEIFSLTTGSVLGPMPQFRRTAGTAGDVNGDGYDDLIVGSRYVSETESGEGQALVYHGSATGLDATPAWTYEGTQVREYMGSSVSTAGDVNGDGFADVIVAALEYDGGETNEGRVLVFHGSASGLDTTPAWEIEGNVAGARLGMSVSTAGDVNGDGYSDVIVGASGYSGAFLAEGVAYVYLGSPTGLATTPAWTETGGQAGARLGTSVSTAGDINGDGYSDVVVAAPNYVFDGDAEGAAFIYHGSASGLAPTWSSTLPGLQASAVVASVGTAGDVNGDGYADVAVGIQYYDSPETDEGALYVVLGSPLGFDTAVLAAQSNQNNAHLGYSVGTAGDVDGDGLSDVIAGAPKFDGTDPDQGRVYLLLGEVDGPSLTADWVGEQSQGGAWLGHSVATAGDVDGDGFSDVIIGARYFDAAFANEGAAFLHLGSAAGLGLAPAWTQTGGQNLAFFGSTVAGAGDVNGDGYGDVIVRASDYDNGEEDEGRAFVYHGSATGLESAPAWMAEGDQEFAYFSHGVAAAGDVNGDGFGDVIVGAVRYDGGSTNEGRVFVYHGSESGLSTTPAWTADGEQVGANLGRSVASAGDVNGDGYGDVIVGAPWFDAGESDEGAAFVYLGSPSGLEATPAWTAEGNQAGARFAWSVASAGDVNGDGFSDVIVGAPMYDDVLMDRGRAFVYLGSPSGLSLVASWYAQGTLGSVEFARSVASAGDVNGDGFSDVIVGVPEYADQGRARVYFGSASGLSASAGWTLESGQIRSGYGHSVGSAGDVNGDGLSDIIVGGPKYNNGQTNEGLAFLYYGGGRDGRHHAVQQMRSDASAPIALGGASDSPGSFSLNVMGFSPLGRSNVWVEAEVKPLGTPFDGSGLITGPTTDTGLVGASLEELIDGLSPDTPYHWRLRVATDSPFYPHTPWYSPPGNGPGELDLRTAGGTVAVWSDPGRDASLSLAPAVPNPFRAVTRIAFTLPEASGVRLAIFDVAGREVAVLADGRFEAGRHEVRWNGADRTGASVGAGIYFARIEARGRSATRSIALIH